MASFIARVELHGGEGADYTNLHTEMGARDFQRKFRRGGRRHELPTGTYISIGDHADSDVAMAAVVAAATAAGFPPDPNPNGAGTPGKSAIVLAEYVPNLRTAGLKSEPIAEKE